MALLGVTFPDVKTIGWTAGGFLIPPFLEGFSRRFLPADFSSSVMGRYIVKVGSVLLLTLGAKKLIGQSEGRSVLLGGSVYLATSAVNDFLMPSLVGAGGGSTRYYMGTPGQRVLSAQPQFFPGTMERGAPERLRPENRY